MTPYVAWTIIVTYRDIPRDTRKRRGIHRGRRGFLLVRRNSALRLVDSQST